jgi:pSer/pThr/pTyr-binding forkhead associated (FHA) protein
VILLIIDRKTARNEPHYKLRRHPGTAVASAAGRHDRPPAFFAARGEPKGGEMVQSQNASDPPVAVHLLDSALGRTMRSWRFEGESLITIGRADDSHVQVSDPYVSRSHAELRRQDGSWMLVSLGRYGVIVQAQQVTELTITADTTFQLGSSGPSLRFELAAGTANNRITETDNRMTMMLDSTLAENMFELDQSKLNEEVGEISTGSYFQELQRRAQQLRRQRQ